MRRVLRMILVPFLAGGLIMGAAWAGAGLTPAPKTDNVVGKIAKKDKKAAVQKVDVEVAEGTPVSELQPLPNGLIYAGASKVDLYPRPEDYDGVWEKTKEECRTFTNDEEMPQANPADHLASTGSPWPENPNCIYMGGFGIGPINPITEYDDKYGIWVRSFAVSDTVDTLVLTVIDAEGYLWDYKNKCTDCGAKHLGQQLGEELGINPDGIVIAATHTHSGPEFLGGWGFVPDWYMTQVKDSIKQSITEAVTTMEPAVVEFGETQARGFNRERRDTYRSAEEQQVGWLRAYVPGAPAKNPNKPGEPPRVIATLGAYAAHPTTRGTNGGVAHADWPGEFEKAVEDRFGGVGLHFMTGLGNMSAAGQTGPGIAGLLPPVGAGEVVTVPTVSATQARWQQPVTNVPLSALGLPGFFDRQFDPQPASVSVGKSDTAPCTSASAVSVELAASAIRIGDRLAITTGPGELFSNLTNTIKEKSPAAVTLPLAQANDALGYMPQSFELDPVGQQGLGFAFSGYVFVNYEDSYAVDRCIGDMVLETTLDLLGG